MAKDFVKIVAAILPWYPKVFLVDVFGDVLKAAV